MPATLFPICQNPTHFSGSFQMYHKQISLMRLIFHQHFVYFFSLMACIISCHGLWWVTHPFVSTWVWKKLQAELEQSTPSIHSSPKAWAWGFLSWCDQASEWEERGMVWREKSHGSTHGAKLHFRSQTGFSFWCHPGTSFFNMHGETWREAENRFKL